MTASASNPTVRRIARSERRSSSPNSTVRTNLCQPAAIGSVSAKLIGGLIRFAESKDIDTDLLREMLPHSLIESESFETRVDLSIYASIWSRVAESVPTIDIGFQFGQFLVSSMSNLQFLIAMHCTDAREAINKIADYKGLLYEGEAFLLREQDGLTVLRLGKLPFEEPVLRYSCDAILSGVNCLVNGVSQSNATPVFIRLPYTSASSSLSAICREISFGYEVAEIGYRTHDLMQSNPLADRRLQQLLESHARTRMLEIGKDMQWTKRVTSMLYGELDGDLFQLDTVASRLALNSRTLQDWLKREGTSFRLIRDAVRLARARTLLKEPGQSIAQVAQALGYSEQSSLNHFFRQKTGLTPSDYRRSFLTRL